MFLVPTWIDKNVEARIASFDGIKICDIVFEIRSNYYLGITMTRAWNAK